MVVFRTVLTAAHCICRYYDFEVDGKRANRYCLPNKSADQLTNQQTDKQRIIWGYKILFLDVMFPLDVKKIIFVPLR